MFVSELNDDAVILQRDRIAFDEVVSFRADHILHLRAAGEGDTVRESANYGPVLSSVRDDQLQMNRLNILPFQLNVTAKLTADADNILIVVVSFFPIILVDDANFHRPASIYYISAYYYKR